MPSWTDISNEEYEDANSLSKNVRYRSAAGRYYYSVFQITEELVSRGAKSDFSMGRETPGHKQIPDLIAKHFTHMSSRRKVDLTLAIQLLYRRRIIADYTQLDPDEVFAREAHRYAAQAFHYLGVRR